MASITLAQSNWVSDFNNCPDNYAAQNCLVEGELVCGYDDPTLECSDPSEINAPSATEMSNSGDTYQSGLPGGFIIDCIDHDGTDPYCSNGNGDIYWCNRNNTCYASEFRQTNCTGGQWAISYCGDCRSDGGGYLNCDTDATPCEVDVNSVCNTNARFNSSCMTIGSGGEGWCVCDSGDYDCDDSDGDGNNETANPDGSGSGCEVTIGSTACATGSNNNQESCSTCVCDNNYYDCDGGWNQDCDIQDSSSCSVGILSGTYNCEVGAGGCYAEDGGTQYTCTCEIDDQDIATTGQLVSWSGTDPMLAMILYSNTIMLNLTHNSTGASLIMNTSGIYWNNSNLAGGPHTVDTSSYINCTGDETFLGNGSCLNTSTIDTTIPDTNYSGCGDGEYGDGSNQCINFNATVQNQTLNESEGNALYLPHTVDTSAFVNCTDDEAFLGNGSCLNTSTIDTTIPDTNYSGCGDGEYGDGNNNCIPFNATVLDLVASTTYLPYNITVIYGTIDDGNITSILTPKDDDSFNISEDAGANALEIIINFTGVIDFNSIIMREWYTGSAGHEIIIGLYDYNEGTYEEEYGDITDMEDFAFTVRDVFDASLHINETNVSLRLRHDQNGIAIHDLFIDYVSLVDGFSTTKNTEHDSMSGRDDPGNHPWALPTDGSRNITSQLNGTNILARNNITALDNLFVGSTTESISYPAFMLDGNDGYIHNQFGVNGVFFADSGSNFAGQINADNTDTSIMADGDVNASGTINALNTGTSIVANGNINLTGIADHINLMVGSVKLLRDCSLGEDGSIFLGEDADVRICFDGTHFHITGPNGTSIFNISNFAEVIIENNLTVENLIVTGDVNIQSLSMKGELDVQGPITGENLSLTQNHGTDVITLDSDGAFPMNLVSSSFIGGSTVTFPGGTYTLAGRGLTNTFTQPQTFSALSSILVGARISHDGNLDNFIEFTLDKQLFVTGNLHMLSLIESPIGNDELVVNDRSADINFRVETNNDANAIWVDGGTDNVGIGEAAPDLKLEVAGDVHIQGLEGSYISGEAYVCVYDNGTIFAKDTACS